MFRNDELCISVSDIVRCICIEHLVGYSSLWIQWIVSDDERVYAHLNVKTFLQYMLDNNLIDDSYFISLDSIIQYCNNIKIVYN